jgi:hypothetical protein
MAHRLLSAQLVLLVWLVTLHVQLENAVKVLPIVLLRVRALQAMLSARMPPRVPLPHRSALNLVCTSGYVKIQQAVVYLVVRLATVCVRMADVCNALKIAPPISRARLAKYCAVMAVVKTVICRALISTIAMHQLPSVAPMAVAVLMLLNVQLFEHVLLDSYSVRTDAVPVVWPTVCRLSLVPSIKPGALMAAADTICCSAHP